MSTLDTCMYALTVEEVKTIRWALLFARSQHFLSELERRIALELEQRLLWRPGEQV